MEATVGTELQLLNSYLQQGTVTSCVSLSLLYAAHVCFAMLLPLLVFL